jgi:DNA-binding transcriptional LysR family regulator
MAACASPPRSRVSSPHIQASPSNWTSTIASSIPSPAGSTSRSGSARIATPASSAGASAARRPWPVPRRPPADLAAHACLQYGNLATGATWRFRRDGETLRVQTSGRLSSNNGEALCEAAVAGAGIALLPDFLVAEALRGGALVSILPGWRTPDLSIHALYPRTRRLSRASRAFIDALARGD